MAIAQLTYPITVIVENATGRSGHMDATLGVALSVQARFGGTKSFNLIDGGRTDSLLFALQPGFTFGEILTSNFDSIEITEQARITYSGRYYRVERFDYIVDEISGLMTEIKAFCRFEKAVTAAVVEAVSAAERAYDQGIDHDIRTSPRRDIRGAMAGRKRR